jgi:pathogenesis-related protein 1
MPRRPARLWRSRSFRAGLLLPLSCVMACFGDETEPDDGVSTAGAGGSSRTSDGQVGSGAGGASGSTMGADPGDGEPSGLALEMLSAHNSVRGSLDASLPDVSWSEDLADYAGEWARELAQSCAGLSHRTQNQFGENIAMRGSSRMIEAFSPEEAVEGWAAEATCWEFGTIRGSEACDSSCIGALNSSGCGHYTQLVWRDTRRIGCGYATCENGYVYEIWVCNYDPPGNFVGQTPY